MIVPVCLSFEKPQEDQMLTPSMGELAKVRVEGSNPFARSILPKDVEDVAGPGKPGLLRLGARPARSGGELVVRTDIAIRSTLPLVQRGTAMVT